MSEDPTARMYAAIAESARAAANLTEVGMKVKVRKDDGSMVETTTTSKPWPLGHGAWLVRLEGFSGGYDCARVTPVPPRLFNAGDKVTWTERTSPSRDRVRFSSKEGTIVTVGPSMCVVRRKNGRTTHVWREDLRHANETNALTEMVFNLGGQKP